MLKKLIATTATLATLAATALSLSTAPAQARVPFVRVGASQCATFNNAGQKVANVRTGFFQTTGGGHDVYGRLFKRLVVVDPTKPNGIGTVNVNSHCLDNNGTRVTKF